MLNLRNLFVMSVLCLSACVPLKSGTPALLQTVTPSVPTLEPLITYQDLQNKFELKYAEKDYFPDTDLNPGEVFALLMDVATSFAGKNLEEVRINLTVGSDCLSLAGYSPLTSDIENVEINGVGFTKYFARDAGTNSNSFDHTTYQTQHANRCFEINISVREYVLEVFPNLTEYSRDSLNAKLEALVQTFRFLD